MGLIFRRRRSLKIEELINRRGHVHTVGGHKSPNGFCVSSCPFYDHTRRVVGLISLLIPHMHLLDACGVYGTLSAWWEHRFHPLRGAGLPRGRFTSHTGRWRLTSRYPYLPSPTVFNNNASAAPIPLPNDQADPHASLIATLATSDASS